MRYWLLLISFFSLIGFTSAQEADTIIYKTAAEMPRFPACEALDTTIAFKIKCAEQQLLRYVYQRIVYPPAAVEQDLEGTVVVSFIVEKNGQISNPQIVKDLGGGTGDAALLVVRAMQRDGILWVPGRDQEGQPLRVTVNLPVRFRLQDAPNSQMIGADTVYVRWDEPLRYEGGAEALSKYLEEELKYPSSGNDSCIIGSMDVQVLIEGDGNVRILDIIDYNDLGFDFWYETVHTSISTYGKWTPAVFEGRNVSTSFDLSMSFIPTESTCSTIVDAYIDAANTAEEGSALFKEGFEAEDQAKMDEGLAKMTKAVDRFPNDSQLLILRGQAYLDANRLQEACVDLSRASRIALINWYDSILPLLCKQ